MWRYFLVSFLYIPHNWALCLNPEGMASQTRYDNNTMYYCNDTNWIEMGGLYNPFGSVQNNILIGKDNNNIDMPYEYESIGVSGSGLNLRLSSPNNIIFHTNITSNEGNNNNKARIIIRKDGNIGIGTTNPHSKAALDIYSKTQGFLPPRMTTIERNTISSPPEGLVLYNLTLKKLEFFNGSAWEQF